MKIAGIIAEYNPFHNGHLYQLLETKKSGATHIIAVMSGSFVQRGDIALCSKWARAKMALLNGVDLVVELPTPFALSSANTFARAGVFILNQLNANMISFGSEEGNIELLKQVTLNICNAENSQYIIDFLKQGISYPRAREKAINHMYGSDIGNIINKANNLLAIEYIKAINDINPLIKPITIKREQAQHDSNIIGDNIASASYLRELVNLNQINKLSNFMPPISYEILEKEIANNLAPVSQKNIEQAMLYKLRIMSVDDFLNIPDVSEGLENRLYEKASKALSITEFFDLVKTKRYTHARIRRIAYNALLSINKDDQEYMPQYIRVLASNKKGFEILSNAKKSSIPISTKFADLYKLSPIGIDIDVRATNIFSLAQPKITPARQDFFNNTIIIK